MASFTVTQKENVQLEFFWYFPAQWKLQIENFILLDSRCEFLAAF